MMGWITLDKNTLIQKLNDLRMEEENIIRKYGYPIIMQHIEEDKELFVSAESIQSIWNPFYDETLRFEVDPINHYGFETIKKLLEELSQ